MYTQEINTIYERLYEVLSKARYNKEPYYIDMVLSELSNLRHYTDQMNILLQEQKSIIATLENKTNMLVSELDSADMILDDLGE